MTNDQFQLAFVALLVTCNSAAAQISTEAGALAVIQEAVIEAIDSSQKSVVAFARGTEDSNKDEPAIASFIPHEYGTGVIIDARGLILTNYHLLGEVQQSVYMVWHQGKVYFPAKVRAADPWTDLAVLEIEGDELTPIALGDGSTIKKGQFVIALGNPYEIAERNSPSATWGIVSNLTARPVKADGAAAHETAYQHGGLIQTDARLKLGTSGGPLVNLKGEMIGLVTCARALSGFSPDSSYAVPVDGTFKRVVDRLKSGHEVKFGFLGVDWNELSLSDRQAGLYGVRLGRVYPGSPALQHGLQSNDILTHVDRRPVNDSSDLSRIISQCEPGTTISVSVRRTDPILRRTRAIQRDVILSKRFVPSRRPLIVTESETPWRGIRVEYPTAVADFRELSARLDVEGCVVVAEVVPDSIGWRAGIRSGDLITHVSNVRVRSPIEFVSATEKDSNDVQVQVIASDGSRSTLNLPVSSEQ